jgi:hypothetical protein
MPLGPPQRSPRCKIGRGSHRHAAGVHRDDFLTKAGEGPLVLGDDHRLKASLAVTRHVDIHRAIIAEDGFAAGAVALVGLVRRFRLAMLVAQLVDMPRKKKESSAKLSLTEFKMPKELLDQLVSRLITPG